MTKVLSDAGKSLADVYDVEGSIAGIDELDSHDVSLVHEMGATIFAERIGSTIHRINAVGAVLQNTVWDLRYVFLPTVISRLVGVTVCVIAAEAGRIGNAVVSIETIDPSVGVPNREIPIWMWDETDDVETPVRWSNAGAAAAPFSFLRPALGPNLPQLLIGTESRFSASMIQFRGLTNGFGAGTVAPILQLHDHFGRIDAPGSFGLPIPSW